MKKTAPWILLVLLCFQLNHSLCQGRETTLEQQALYQIAAGLVPGNCIDKNSYHVYLIDNFDQQVELVPELNTSHGDLVLAMLVSGRDDIKVTALNTSLVRGLAQTLLDINAGVCIDAVVSAIPGSNYSYDQVSTLLGGSVPLGADNILEYKDTLRNLMLQIAGQGFPDLKWLLQLDANPVKLREDAKKIAFIDTLGSLAVPVYLPYGNRDGLHRGNKRVVNLLALASGVRIYSGLDGNGEKTPYFPYSPLASGGGQAKFTLMECPDRRSGLVAHLDIDEDGVADFSYTRGDMIAYYDSQANLAYAPAPVESHIFEKMIADREFYGKLFSKPGGLVVSKKQFNELCETYPYPDVHPKGADTTLVWLNSGVHNEIFTFNPQCRRRGTLSGSSFIPPLKVKEFLVEKVDSGREG